MAQIDEFSRHLQVLSGTAVNPSASPVCFTAGLPAIATLWTALNSRGGADILMASTAYGGSSQLTDLLEKFSPSIKKHTFDIQGSNDMIQSIKSRLSDHSRFKQKTTVVFVEIPTNPDMKVICIFLILGARY